MKSSTSKSCLPAKAAAVPKKTQTPPTPAMPVRQHYQQAGGC